MDVDLRLLKEGNEHVFRQIVQSCEGRLNRFAMIYTQNRAVSEEIVSDTFLSLWINRHSLDENTRLIPYLTVILRNKCINYLRSFRHKFVSIDEMDIGAIYMKAHLYTERIFLLILFSVFFLPALTGVPRRFPGNGKITCRVVGIKNEFEKCVHSLFTFNSYILGCDEGFVVLYYEYGYFKIWMICY